MPATDDGHASRNAASPREPQRVVLPGELNLLGRAVYLAGSIIGLATRTAGAALDSAQTIWHASERAFHAGLDEGVEDARIVEEVDRDQS
ncbi:MAG: hypothetical protein COV99_07980 [Bacteroidetes bacterium CG12_big_fil_rev_8_21_14_0_65_60_17]|nr:MAG: hypothetical protein COV99_07980 [Bacteroidetes bacterium CG12_big_fil_rev_8_21_14_0_65_60_17]